MSEQIESRTPSRGTLRLLLDPSFGVYILGRLFSAGGVWIYNTAAAVLIYEITRSAVMVGLVSVCQFAPQIALAPVTGALADRFDRRAVLVLGRLLVAIGAGALSWWLWMHPSSISAAQMPILVSSLIVGIGFAVLAPAQNALVPNLVRRDELAAAIELNTFPAALARAIGPAVGVALALSIGFDAAFAFAAGANFVFALLVLPLKVMPNPAAPTPSDKRIRTGIRFVWRSPRLVVLILGIAAVGMGADPAITLAPAAAAAASADASFVGILVTSFGLGSCLALTCVSALRRRLDLPWLGASGLLLLAIGNIATGVTSTPPVMVVGMGLAGLGMTFALTSITTQILELTPDELRGRTMALWAIAFVGSRPFAAAMNGIMAELFSPGIGFVMTGAICLVAAWFCRPGYATAPDSRTL